MARTSKKSVYERIEDKKNEILKTEEMLVQLNNELQELFNEKDDLEMRQLLDAMKAKGLSINEALAKIGNEEIPTEEIKSSKSKKKKDKEESVTSEIVETVDEQL